MQHAQSNQFLGENKVEAQQHHNLFARAVRCGDDDEDDDDDDDESGDDEVVMLPSAAAAMPAVDDDAEDGAEKE